MLSSGDVRVLLKVAKDAVITYLKEGYHIKPPTMIPQGLKDRKAGVFVTVSKLDDLLMKSKVVSCCGNPISTKPLVEAVIDFSVSAAIRAKLLASVKAEESDKLVLTVNILTKPELIHAENPARYAREIKIGEDGLIVEKGTYKGVLLPSVALENRWDEVEFLSECCVKAGLQPDSWLAENVKIYKFKTSTFAEKVTNCSIQAEKSSEP